MTSAAQLSTYIIAFAGAARTAQRLMSSGMDPMTIAEFYFEVNLTTDFEIKSETDVSLNIWRMSIKEKLTLDYKEHMGLTVKCTIKPAAVLAAQGGSAGGGAA
jgi:outer membrane protein W